MYTHHCAKSVLYDTVYINTQNIHLSKYKTAYIQESAGIKYATVYAGRSSTNEVYAREYINIIPPCILHILVCIFFNMIFFSTPFSK